MARNILQEGDGVQKQKGVVFFSYLNFDRFTLEETVQLCSIITDYYLQVNLLIHVALLGFQFLQYIYHNFMKSCWQAHAS